MKVYVDKSAVCYQLEKQATRDGQPRAIRRAKKIVEEFPVDDVRRVIYCKDCSHWNKDKTRIDICVEKTACCRWFTRQGNYIETSEHDFCSYATHP